MADSEIWNNRFLRTKTAPHEHYYGIKGRQAKRCRIHHNTIEVNFSIEFPFENDEDVEIAHNICHGTISIPKHAGGPVPASGRTFHIHHNLFRDTYAIEFVRNGVEVDHNLFDFDPARDHGNLISGFGKAPASGPASFHHNLVSNPGRGVIWINEPFNQLDVHHNHIIARTTKTPRTEGLFGFHPACDFKTFRFTGNVIECIGPARPLLRNDASATATIGNNQLINISDTARYSNQRTDEPAGLGGPLKFRCGVNGEVSVQDWKTSATPAQ
jgi:nitrous oxidase accessory protein